VKHEASVSLSRIVPLVRVCELAGVARSSVYARRRATVVEFPKRRGPKTCAPQLLDHADAGAGGSP
jgi:hypothetical protein